MRRGVVVGRGREREGEGAAGKWRQYRGESRGLSETQSQEHSSVLGFAPSARRGGCTDRAKVILA